jgi:hypothetical protein
MTCCFSFRSRRCSYRLCEPFRDAIELVLSQGRNATAIWQDLVSESGFGQPPQPREKAQTDYGAGPLVRDPQTGEYWSSSPLHAEAAFSR